MTEQPRGRESTIACENRQVTDDERQSFHTGVTTSHLFSDYASSLNVENLVELEHDSYKQIQLKYETTILSCVLFY
jgi:hypothetical protein